MSCLTAKGNCFPPIGKVAVITQTSSDLSRRKDCLCMHTFGRFRLKTGTFVGIVIDAQNFPNLVRFHDLNVKYASLRRYQY